MGRPGWGLRAGVLLPLSLVGAVACLPAVEIGEADGGAGSTGASPGEPGAGDGLFRFQVDECREAAEAACGPELDACSRNDECTDYFSCWFDCEPTDLNCRAECTKGSLLTAEIELRHCVARSALHECATETLHFDRRGRTCAQCATQCDRELKACLASEGCSRLVGCEATNPSLLPSECERDIPEEDLTAAALRYKSLVDQCLAMRNVQGGCGQDCNEAWGCLGEYEHPVDEGWNAIGGSFGPSTTFEDSFNFIQVTIYVTGLPNFAPLMPVELTACRKDDVTCATPLQTESVPPGGTAFFDKIRVGTPIGFDGFFLVDGPLVFPGRLQGMMPKVPGVPGVEQAHVIAPANAADLGAVIPDYDPEALFVAGSVGDCANLLASGVTITASTGRVYYLTEDLVPRIGAAATDDRGLFTVVDLQPGSVTLTARYDGRVVSELDVRMVEDRYSGVHLIPLPRSKL